MAPSQLHGPRRTVTQWLALYCLLFATLVVAAGTPAPPPRHGSDTIREAGRCSLGQTTCGQKGGVFGEPLPCVSNELAVPLADDPSLAASLLQVCGPEVAVSWTSVCCNQGSLDRLSQSLQQAQAFIALCPACSRSFTSYYCHFTCSPDQSTFVTVSDVQDLGDAKGPAVKSLELHVDQDFGESFYDACANVKFAATNGLAMDFIGGGAKDWKAFLRYMGQERPGLGSPFQINIPQPANQYNGSVDPLLSPVKPALLSCASPDPSVACACADCPERCLSLPPLPDQHGSTCHVGALSCGSFFLVLGYTILLLSFMAGIGIRDLWERRHTFFRNKNNGEGRIHLPASPGEYDRMDLTDPTETRDSLFGGGGHESAEIGQRWKLTMRRLFGGQGMRGSNRSRADSSSPSTSSHRRPQSAASSANIGGADSDSNANSLHRPRLGRGASLISPDILAAYSQPRTYRLNTLLSTGFYKLGLACASAPWLTIALGLAVCGALNAGWSRFAVERDPVKLWVSHDSELAVQKRYFEQEFGPFYRTEQIFLHKGHDEEPVLDWNTIVWWADVEDQIRKLRSPAGTSLEKVCFAPTADSPEAATASDCTVQSFLGYFKDNLDGITEENWEEELDACATNPTSCLSSAGQPLNPRLLFGGVPGYSGEHTRSAPADGIRASEARALVVTYVINNSLDKAVVRRAAEWERALKQFLADLQKTALNERGLKVSFSTEVSLEEELNKATNTDVPIVVLSYVVMFLYVSISLGGTGAGFVALIWAILLRAYHLISGSRSQSAGPISLGHTQDRTTSTSSSSTGVHHLPDNSVSAAVQNLFVDSKFMLGLLGIAIVLLSVSTSVGLFSFFGVRVTLIIAEVIPFLVLAIGVDNVFILAHELERQNARAYGPAPLSATDEFDVPPAEERVGRALGRMGPSILLSSSCQTVAFGLGAFVGMPAVRNFAIYAAGAVAINALLQVTVFVAAMTVDLKRIESHRVDCLPCIKLVAERDRPAGHTESIVVRFIRSVYAPFLLKRQVKYAVVATFAGLFVASWICTDYIQLGLDQRLALPRRSYLVDYFDALDAYLDVGPPVYFVSESADVEHRPVQQALCGRFSTCDDFSLANVLEAERKRPKLSYLAEPPAVWLDDFFQWLNPILESCCSVKKRNPSEFCGPDDNELLCKPCYEDREPGWNITMEGLPEGDEFIRYLHQWLESPANQDCALGGKAGYSSAVAFDRETGAVQASHFRTYHTPLKHQSDFIDALASAKRISEDLSARTGTKVFPYSIFYVYFEQYARIVTTTRAVLALALLAVFTVTSLLLGSWRTGSVVVLTVFLIVMNVMGVMGIWHISLNAISLVNLVIAIGIGVEFCSHIARAFMGAGAGGGGLPHSHPAGQKERDDRAYAALIDVGSSVFSGITLTKIIGISVLALTKSKLLEIYYFRMWLTLILSGALHGLVFLPVALSFQGGQGYSLDDKEDLDFIEEVARYRGRPFFAGDEDDDDQSVSSGDRF